MSIEKEGEPGGPRAVPVLIIGAGPVGLTMAIALRSLGIDCRIIDAGDGPTPEHESRALGVQARTMEVFKTLGIADRLLEGGVKVVGATGYRSRRTWFQLGMETLSQDTEFPFILSIPQGATERILVERLERLAGRVEWRTSLSDLRQEAGEVIAELRSVHGPESVVTHWLVGCDGARSIVRERLGIGFEGSSYPEWFLLADVKLLWSLPNDRAVIMLTPQGVVPAIPLPAERSWRLIDTTDRLDSDDPGAIIERFRTILRDHAPDPQAELIKGSWTSRFRIHRKAASRFRLGHCFLAGDSAHVHSPVGGQGMNTGVQDAFNLSWKLAMVIRRRASEDLLDTYDLERRTVAEAVLSGTDRATRILTIRNPIFRRARDQIMPALVAIPMVRRLLVRGVAELDFSYRSSPLSLDGQMAGTGPTSDLLRAGDRLPDYKLGAGRRLLDSVRGPWWTLLIVPGGAVDRENIGPNAIGPVLDRFEEEHLGDLVEPIVVCKCEFPLERNVPVIEDPEGLLRTRFGFGDRGGLCLVRPDGYIGFLSHSLDQERLAAAFTFLDSVSGEE